MKERKIRIGEDEGESEILKRRKRKKEWRKKRAEGGFLTSGRPTKDPRNSKAELKDLGGDSRLHHFFVGRGNPQYSSHSLHDL